MEACATAHYWAREIGALGHEVRMMPPAYVKPYVKRQKNDAADAEAICEGVTRSTMRFVPVKSAERQGVLVLHRTRDLLMRQRTMILNAIRGHMAEFGVIAAQGLSNLLSGNSAESGSRILAFPLDVGLGVRGPFFVDLDEDGGDEALEGVVSGKDPDLDGAALELLLDGALHRVGGPHAAVVVLGEREDGEALGYALLQPCREFRGGGAVGRDQFGEGGFGLRQ
jgi:transposase